MRRSTCIICGTVTRGRKDSATCGKPECYSIRKSDVTRKVTESGNGQHWTRELQPWPEGVRFDSIVEPDDGVFVPPPRPHAFGPFRGVPKTLAMPFPHHRDMQEVIGSDRRKWARKQLCLECAAASRCVGLRCVSTASLRGHKQMWVLLVTAMGFGTTQFDFAYHFDTRTACEAALVRVWNRKDDPLNRIVKGSCKTVDEFLPNLTFEIQR